MALIRRCGIMIRCAKHNFINNSQYTQITSYPVKLGSIYRHLLITTYIHLLFKTNKLTNPKVNYTKRQTRVAVPYPGTPRCNVKPNYHNTNDQFSEPVTDVVPRLQRNKDEIPGSTKPTGKM